MVAFIIESKETCALLAALPAFPDRDQTDAEGKVGSGATFRFTLPAGRQNLAQ